MAQNMALKLIVQF